MDTARLTSLLRALADPIRLRMVALLTRRDFCGCELVPLFGVSQPAVSQHLRRLKAVGLVSESRHGQWVFYHLEADVMRDVRMALEGIGSFALPWLDQIGSGPAGCPLPAPAPR